MRLLRILGLLALLLATDVAAASTQGLYDLVKRRIPAHASDFTFTLIESQPANSSSPRNDEYSISTVNGTISIQGNSLSALATGLRRYLNDVAHVDIYWFIGSRLEEAPRFLLTPNGTITGKSVVPWRYHFNTVTFSYTTPFWSWSNWELQLDWMALHGVNLPLAWVGFEKILLDVFRGVGLSDAQIIPFFSGPAFQAWNRFGNIQGSWGGELPTSWIDSQFDLQKKILGRMLELGMTPILPAFTGFVPRGFTEVYPNATVVNGSRWNDFQPQYTNTTFLEPSDSLFAKLQTLTIQKQIEYYGNITQFYTLDQYNENDPFSGDVGYLKNVTQGTWQSLKSANPAAVWVMQGWLFFVNSDFWTDERVEAYLSGVENNSDMLVLDLFSESQPQWQRTKSYYGKPWIWCQLHNFGGNMGLYGQIENLTVDPIEAVASSSNLVGFGLTPEGQEGNEIVYDLLLDQAWSSAPIDTSAYFRNWVRNRYTGNNSIPDGLFTAWEFLRTTVYNNTKLESTSVLKSIFELAPNITGLVDRTGHHPTVITYPNSALISAYQNLDNAGKQDPQLWQNPAFQHDVVDITRQLVANAFIPQYQDFVDTWNTTFTSPSNSTQTYVLKTKAQKLTDTLDSLDQLLSTLPEFRLDTWINSARSLAPGNDTTIADFYEYNARNQITLWGPNGEINDYASKQWSGLIGGYYKLRWQAYLDYLVANGPGSYDVQAARNAVKVVEQNFQNVGKVVQMARLEDVGDLKSVVGRVAGTVL